jgi:CRP/FNR family transcriptional regulator, cyclic AMP receptor protein
MPRVLPAALNARIVRQTISRITARTATRSPETAGRVARRKRKGKNMENPLWSFINLPKKKEDILDVLAVLPAFDGLSKNELRLVGRMLHERRYRKGEIVFNEGEPGAGMYIVITGEVEITRKISGANDMSLAVIREHSFFGELALLDEIPRSASAVAKTDSVLFGFSKPSLETLYNRNPRLGIKILSNLSRLVCRRLVKSNEAMEKFQTSFTPELQDQKVRESMSSNV